MSVQPEPDPKPSIFDAVPDEDWDEPDDDPGEAGFPVEGPVL